MVIMKSHCVDVGNDFAVMKGKSAHNKSKSKREKKVLDTQVLGLLCVCASDNRMEESRLLPLGINTQIES